MNPLEPYFPHLSNIESDAANIESVYRKVSISASFASVNSRVEEPLGDIFERAVAKLLNEALHR